MDLLSLKARVLNRLMQPFFILYYQLIKNKRDLILIINGSEKTVSEVHRVHHLMDKLKLLKIRYFCVSINMLNLIRIDSIESFSKLFIHRSRKTARLENLIKHFKIEGKLVIYDTDDLIFDASRLTEVAALNNKSSQWKTNFSNAVVGSLNIMKKTDGVITPTIYLSDYVRNNYNLKTFVLRNHLDSRSLHVGSRIANQRKQKNEVILGYFSGTRTHDKDFATITPALVSLLKRYPNLVLKIVGPLTLDPLLSTYRSQIRKHRRVPYHRVMRMHRDVDIVLAPLEQTVFCQGKSELKYIFAGAAAIPTVATDTSAYQDAIKDGINGYLCASVDEWEHKLRKLIRSPILREKMGQKAFKNVHSTYTPEYQAQALQKLLSSL